jgi:hypothetical protein
MESLDSSAKRLSRAKSILLAQFPSLVSVTSLETLAAKTRQFLQRKHPDKLKQVFFFNIITLHFLIHLGGTIPQCGKRCRG